ncbi:MAG: retroviral-like aspartic protease family protein [Candidatus Eremiobacteraeota bacterium]|nr:retroviral-like aspartic protease family protein [Candidatus Eremiobacteraeota bacterium]
MRAAVLLFLALCMSGVRPQQTGLSIPFTYLHHEVLVSARIGTSGPYNFLLDTDTSPSAIDAALAKRLGLHQNGASGLGSGVGSNKTVTTPVRIPDLSVGAVHVRSLQALTADLSGLSKHFGRPLAGVLGTSFLRGRVTEFNYPCRTIVFLSDAPVAPITASFHGDDENIIDKVMVNGHRATATFDTGNAGAVLVTARGIADLGLAAASKNGTHSLGYGYNGSASSSTGRLSDVRVGAIDFGPTAAKFMASVPGPYDINIGNRVMERYRVVFDYVRTLVTFLPPAPGGCTR